MLNICIAQSRNQNSYDAGEEIGLKIMQSFKEPPTILFLFSTIHHEKNNGLQNILMGVRSQISERTQIIGGTVAGFMTPEGIFTRGIAALAILTDEIEFKTEFATGTKRNPKGIIKNFTKLKEKLSNQQYNSNFILELLSGPKIPQFPVIGYKTLIESDLGGRVLTELIPFTSLANTGVDNADYFIYALAETFPGYLVAGGSLIDDCTTGRNYQFYNSRIRDDAMILTSMRTNLNITINSVFGYSSLGKKFEVTKTDSSRRTILEFDGKPAFPEYLKKLKWDKSDIPQMAGFYRRFFQYPFGYVKEGIPHAYLIGYILGQNIFVGNKLESNDLEILSLSGRRALDNLETIISKLDPTKIVLLLSISCETFLEALGSRMYDFYEKFKKNLPNVPYFIIFVAGESIINRDGVPHQLYESINLIRFEKP